MKRRTSLTLSLLPALIAALLLGGCTLLPRPEAQAVSRYRIELPPPAPATTGGEVLLLAVTRVAPGIDTPRMAYREQPGRLGYFRSARWVEDPAAMLQPVLAARLTAQPGVAAVVGRGTPLGVRHRLELEVLEFTYDLVPEQDRFLLRARLRLIDLAQRRLAVAREFEVSEPVAGKGPAAAAKAANRAVARWLASVARFMAEGMAEAR
ncbi:ABC-type transport auxiliary lipoprotein family protein [Thiohalobacter sp.]|uniref:ABC-type transport auxiliary lipoprotein family protein n=1 Tax=Thiohalobacter sp. TaxID=2025948 RepID=UPI00260FE5BB|nr:ABC-type transport auxiliary lipoprotein family protein [Thiohalobacter sp.]